MRTVILLFLSGAGFLGGCTNGQPEISKSVSFDAISFNGKTVADAKIASTPVCNAALSVPGQCDPRLTKFEASLDGGVTWVAVPGSDADCADGRFTLELPDACAALGVSTGASVTKEILLRGETGAWKEDNRALRVTFAPAPVLTLSAANNVVEGAPLLFTASLSAPAERPVTVNYASTDGTAKAGEDFTGGTGSVVIEQGRSAVTFAVTTISDGVYEAGAEDFTMTISSPSAVELGTSSVTGIIRDFDRAPIVRMLTAAKNVAEDAGTVSVELRTDTPSVKPLNIKYRLGAGGTASAADHGLVAGSALFPELSTSASIEVPITDDLLVEGTETLVVELESDLNAVASVDAAGSRTTLSIVDNDFPYFSVDDVTGTEGSGLTFTVRLSTAPAGNVSVDYATVNGTAVAGTNFTAKTGTLNFTSVVLTQSLTVPGLDVSDICAADKSFTVVLSNPSSLAIIGVGTATGTFVDPDRPTISVGATSAAEGDPMSIPVTLSAPCPTHDVRFDWAMTHGTTEAGDLTLLAGSSLIPRGASSTTIDVTSTEDATDEDDEQFIVTLSHPVEATLATAVGASTILDDDPPPVVSFLSNISVMEGQTARFTASLSAASEKTVTAPINLSYGSDVIASAATGADFGAIPFQVSFPPGQTTAFFDVPITDNGVDDLDRSFTVTITAPTNATVGNDHAAGIIIDNDGPPVVSVAVSSATVAEGGTVNFIVSKTAISAFDYTVNYSLSGSAAPTDRDGGSGGAMIISAADLSKTLTLNIVDDSLEENQETVVFTITSVVPVGGAVPSVAAPSATTTILANDVAPPSSLTLGSGLKAIDTVATPTIMVGGLSGSSTVYLYKDATCSSLVGSATTTGTAVGVISATLAEGVYEFHARRQAYGVSSPCSAATVTYHYLSLQVRETFAGKTNWNDYVLSGTGGDCPPTTVGPPSACIHAGERREVKLPGFETCAGLHVSDTLGAFDWSCVEGSPVRFVTTDLKPHMRLAGLITVGGATPAWKTDSVSLYKDNQFAVTGPSTIWWTNTLRYLVPAAGIFAADQPGSIYVTNAAPTSVGSVQILASRVGIVIRPDQVLTYNGNSASNCKTGGSASYNSVCLVSANNQNFLWFEGDTDGNPGVSTALTYNVYLYGVKFSRVRQANIFFSRLTGLSLIASSSNTVSGVRLSSHSWLDAGGSGFAVANGSTNNVVRDLFSQRNNSAPSSGFMGAGVKIQKDSVGNILTGILAVNNAEQGIFLNDAAAGNVLSHFTAVNNGQGNNSVSGLKIRQNSDDNVVTQGFIANNYYSGLEVEGAAGNHFSQLHAQTSDLVNDNQYATAIRLVNSADSTFDYRISANKCYLSGSDNLSNSCAVVPAGTATNTVVTTNEYISASTGALTGPRMVADYANPATTPSGTMITSTATMANILEFRNPFRGWAPTTTGNFSAGQRGVCASGNCRIWDFSISSASASVLRDANGVFVAGAACPDSVQGSVVARQADTTPFLLNAREIVGDGIGDDDGLCESNEACAFSPHRGGYQAMTAPVRSLTCDFSAGAVTGVTMYGVYPTTLDGDLSNAQQLIAVSEAQTLATRIGATSSTPAGVRTLAGKTAGKWYFEATLAAGTFTASVGAQVGVGSAPLAGMVGAAGYGYAFDVGMRALYVNGGATSYAAVVPALGTGDTIGVAVDLTNNQVWLAVNGVWLGGGNPSTGTNPTATLTRPGGTSFFPAISLITQGTSVRANFGQSQFRAPVPAGFGAGWY